MSTKKEETTTTAIATLGTNDVPKMLEQVKEQIKLLKGNLPDAPVTDKAITGFGKIEDIKDLSTLIKLASSCLGREKSYKEAAKVVMPEGMKTPPFTVNGMTVKNIIEHIKVRSFTVGNETKLKTLKDIQKTLESNLSAEAKLANDLAKIANLMTGQ